MELKKPANCEFLCFAEAGEAKRVFLEVTETLYGIFK